MTRDDIIRMAREAGWTGPEENVDYTNMLKRFAKLVAAAERQACIQLLEDFSQTQMVPVLDTWRMGLIAGANALRARGRDD